MVTHILPTVSGYFRKLQNKTELSNATSLPNDQLKLVDTQSGEKAFIVSRIDHLGISLRADDILNFGGTVLEHDGKYFKGTIVQTVNKSQHNFVIPVEVFANFYKDYNNRIANGEQLDLMSYEPIWEELTTDFDEELSKPVKEKKIKKLKPAAAKSDN